MLKGILVIICIIIEIIWISEKIILLCKYKIRTHIFFRQFYDRELLNDISRQGREVEVLAPALLREKTAQEARAIVAIYSR
jgi:predicted DNA-binding transcriptional regulator YafY